MESYVHGPSSVPPSGAPHVMRRVAGQPHRAWPYEDSSRMKGNFHVRFLEGGGLATACPHSLAIRASKADAKLLTGQDRDYTNDV